MKAQEHSWGRLEASWSALEAVSRPLGALLEPSRGLSEGSWSRLEAPWSRLERFRGPSGSDLSFFRCFFDVFRGQKREEFRRVAKGCEGLRSLQCKLVYRYRRLGGWRAAAPTGKSCFVFVFALRACVRDATRDQGVSRHVFVPPSPSPSPAAASRRGCETSSKKNKKANPPFGNEQLLLQQQLDAEPRFWPG